MASFIAISPGSLLELISNVHNNDADIKIVIAVPGTKRPWLSLEALLVLPVCRSLVLPEPVPERARHLHLELKGQFIISVGLEEIDHVVHLRKHNGIQGF